MVNAPPRSSSGRWREGSFGEVLLVVRQPSLEIRTAASLPASGWPPRSWPQCRQATRRTEEDIDDVDEWEEKEDEASSTAASPVCIESGCCDSLIRCHRCAATAVPR
jgi:hypothetical protein